jgi:hypothetical protein
MDLELQNKVNDTIEQLEKLSIDGIDFQQMDPIAKMMFVALVHEIQKIHDHIDSLDERIVERYCTDFIPRQEVEAMPAIALLQPSFKPNKDSEGFPVGFGAQFSYKTEQRKQPINYIPLFNTLTLPYSEIIVVHQDNEYCKSANMYKPNRLWVGIKTNVEVEHLKGLSFLIKGTNGVTPEHIYAGIDSHELDFATPKEMEQVEMAEPFDAQQASGQFFSFLGMWKESLLNMKEASLLFITDETKSRDLFKPRAYPKQFEQWNVADTLEQFEMAKPIWLQIEFPEGYVVPSNCEVVLNVVPVVNVDICSLTLSDHTPIAKLQKQEDSFFLSVLETSASSNRQGFGMLNEEIIVRDFDASCYHNGDLYRDMRNLYNHFIDDYYAFMEYNEIKDEKTQKLLRETINKIANNNSIKEPSKKFKFDSGTYVMKNLRQSQLSSSIKVNYITTQGEIGNLPHAGETMDNKKTPVFNQKVPILVSAMGGADKATADERYELLRYYSLTNDRLYTKMDIDAFLRKEIMVEFGREEFKRIIINISIEGANGDTSVQRGLYIDICFKDNKNYQRALDISFDKLMQQRIQNKSCIAMPIIVVLRNLEE